MGEYKSAYVSYILMDIFPFTEKLNSIGTSEAACILLWLLQTFCRQEEECSVYIISVLSDLIVDGQTTTMLPFVWLERAFSQK